MSEKAFADEAIRTVVDRTVELTRIPAPSGSEHRRAALVAEWWRRDGLDHVSVDQAGNVWGCVPGTSASAAPVILVCAHLDTVFDEAVALDVYREGDVLYGPGVGDDGVAVAALSAAVRGFDVADSPPVWLVATTSEEGLGNLRGIYVALNRRPARVGAVIAVEGNFLGRIGTRGVSSERWAVELAGPGGHSWEAAENPSAVHEASRMVCDLLANLDAGPPRRTINVGRFMGGDNVTSRAPGASLLVDLRAEVPRDMTALRQRLLVAARGATARRVDVSLRQLGRRGGGGIDREHPLVAVAEHAHASVGRPAELIAASTDANAAYDLGIPAITIGITDGARQHSLEEWISIPPISAGMTVLAEIVRHFGRHLVQADGPHERMPGMPGSVAGGGSP